MAWRSPFFGSPRTSIRLRKMLEFPALDLSPFDRFGLTPLDDAIRHGHVPVQKLLGGTGFDLKRTEIWLERLRNAAGIGCCHELHVTCTEAPEARGSSDGQS